MSSFSSAHIVGNTAMYAICFYLTFSQMQYTMAPQLPRKHLSHGRKFDAEMAHKTSNSNREVRVTDVYMPYINVTMTICC